MECWAWGGFSDAQIGSSPPFRPGSDESYDRDKDYVKDAYEDTDGQVYHFSSSSKNAVLRWWENAPDRDDNALVDDEMYVLLWGSWNSYLVGSLVIDDTGNVVEKDWSRNGWLDYFYPRGK